MSKILDTFLKKSLKHFIFFYKKFISPYKGFRCAHSHYTGGSSCSTYGLETLNENDFKTSLKLIFHRFHACSYVYSLYQEERLNLSYKQTLKNKQSGFLDCDVGLYICDCPVKNKSINCCSYGKLSSAIEVCSCLELIKNDNKDNENLKEKKKNIKNKDYFFLINSFEKENVYKHKYLNYLYLINKDIKLKTINDNEKDIINNSTIYSKNITIEELKEMIENEKSRTT